MASAQWTLSSVLLLKVALLCSCFVLSQASACSDVPVLFVPSYADSELEYFVSLPNISAAQRVIPSCLSQKEDALKLGLWESLSSLVLNISGQNISSCLDEMLNSGDSAIAVRSVHTFVGTSGQLYDALELQLPENTSLYGFAADLRSSSEVSSARFWEEVKRITTVHGCKAIVLGYGHGARIVAEAMSMHRWRDRVHDTSLISSELFGESSLLPLAWIADDSVMSLGDLPLFAKTVREWSAATDLVPISYEPHNFTLLVLNETLSVPSQGLFDAVVDLLGGVLSAPSALTLRNALLRQRSKASHFIGAMHAISLAGASGEDAVVRCVDTGVRNVTSFRLDVSDSFRVTSSESTAERVPLVQSPCGALVALDMVLNSSAMTTAESVSLVLSNIDFTPILLPSSNPWWRRYKVELAISGCAIWTAAMLVLFLRLRRRRRLQLDADVNSDGAAGETAGGNSDSNTPDADTDEPDNPSLMQRLRARAAAAKAKLVYYAEKGVIMPVQRGAGKVVNAVYVTKRGLDGLQQGTADVVMGIRPRSVALGEGNSSGVVGAADERAQRDSLDSTADGQSCVSGEERLCIIVDRDEDADDVSSVCESLDLTRDSIERMSFRRKMELKMERTIERVRQMAAKTRTLVLRRRPQPGDSESELFSEARATGGSSSELLPADERNRSAFVDRDEALDVAPQRSTDDSRAAAADTEAATGDLVDVNVSTSTISTRADVDAVADVNINNNVHVDTNTNTNINVVEAGQPQRDGVVASLADTSLADVHVDAKAGDEGDAATADR